MRRLATFTAAALLCACAAPALAQSEPLSKPEKTEGMKKDAVTLKVGDTAPVLSIDKWIKGNQVSQFEPGKVYVVEFWATWCGPCIRAMPHLTKLQKQYKDKQVTIIGVTSEDLFGNDNSLADVQEMVEHKGDGIGYTMAWDRGHNTEKAYLAASGARGIPNSYVVDQKGKIAYMGHPMSLDFVLPRVLAGNWDINDGPKALKTAMKDRKEIMEQAEDDPKAAVKAMDAYAAKYPEFAGSMDEMRYQLLVQAGESAEASKVGSRIVDQLAAEKDAQGLNEVAWGIVDPQSQMKVKDYALAMKAALKANEVSGDKNAAILDTLARCYFVKGDRMKAIEFQKKALAAVTEDEEGMKSELEDSLREYEKGSN